MSAKGQEILVVGNSSRLGLVDDSTYQFHFSDSIPDTLSNYSSIMIFSTSYSSMDSSERKRMYAFVEEGGGLYCGADNMPFQSEFNTISYELIGKKTWGNFEENKALSNEYSPLKLKCSDTIDAGETPVAVPLDVRMEVEAWINDEPIITSMKYGNGMIVFDGGYSRFYAPMSVSGLCVLETIIELLHREAIIEEED